MGVPPPLDRRRTLVRQAHRELLAALQLLVVDADAGRRRQVLADLPGVLQEQGPVLLCRLAAGADLGARHAPDRTEVGIRPDLDLSARRRLVAIRQRERGAGAAEALQVVDVLVGEAVAHLVAATRVEQVGGLDRELRVATLVRLVKYHR
jgi:hypothetical protein